MLVKRDKNLISLVGTLSILSWVKLIIPVRKYEAKGLR